MLTEERRGAIMHLLRENGKVQVKDLSRRFKTSEVTIRGDLKDLHQRGLLYRAHGGAVLPDPLNVEAPLREKFRARMAEKQRIGAAAAALINDGETIILDSGTTTQEIAKRIKDRENLRVITNGVNIAMELVGVRGVQVILLGGVLRDNSFSIVGHFAEQMLDGLVADKLFLAADGCDPKFGISTPNVEESQVNLAMLRSAREKILVADSSKFGKTSLSRIVSLFEMNRIISDKGLSKSLQKVIRARGKNLDLV